MLEVGYWYRMYRSKVFDRLKQDKIKIEQVNNLNNRHIKTTRMLTGEYKRFEFEF